MNYLKALWHRHLAAWHRVDKYLARQRGDLLEEIEHSIKADRQIGIANKLTGKLYG